MTSKKKLKDVLLEEIDQRHGSVLLQKLQSGVPFVRLMRPNGQVWDAVLKSGRVVLQQKTLQPKGEPLTPSDDELLSLEQNWNLEHGLDSSNSWIP